MHGFGPRTDVRYMTRAQLLRSAWHFLRAAIVMTVCSAAVGYFAFGVRPNGDVNPLILGLLFVLFILSGMGCVGALYLAVRGLARKASYDPVPVWRADQESWRDREGLVEASGIELHDSTVKSLEVQGTDVVVWMDAYVHRSIGVPGRDAGTGWIHLTALRFSAGRCEAPDPKLPAEISGGTLHLGARQLENVFAVPLDFSGSVRLELELVSARKMLIEGDGLTVSLMDDGTYIEHFHP
ncbi:MAG TPA: hypothetical protein VJY35_05355 [Candidatus Eisenbacteria bacterium]|nr:hypothetical protein [Candidatus Eisenbacteria bacterium]